MIYAIFVNPVCTTERIWSHTNWTIRFLYQSMIQPLALGLLPESCPSTGFVLAINDLCPPQNRTVASRNGHKRMKWVDGAIARIPNYRVAVIPLTDSVLNLMNGSVYSSR